MMYYRLFSRDEARRLLPELQRVLRQMQEAKAALTQLQARLKHTRPHTPERRALEEEARFLIGSLEADKAYLDQLGVHLKDLDRGLVDFPARLGGQIVFLCWQLGEPDITHWHPLTGGYAERRPLPQAEPPLQPTPAPSASPSACEAR